MYIEQILCYTEFDNNKKEKHRVRDDENVKKFNKRKDEAEKDNQ